MYCLASIEDFHGGGFYDMAGRRVRGYARVSGVIALANFGWP